MKKPKFKIGEIVKFDNLYTRIISAEYDERFNCKWTYGLDGEEGSYPEYMLKKQKIIQCYGQR